MTLLLSLFAPALGADFLQVDAGAPGMAVQVSVLRDAGGFSGAEVVTTSCADVVVGPVFVLDRGANPAAPVAGAVLSTVFFVDAAAALGDCVVSIDGTALAPLSAGVDNLFSIVDPLPAPVDGGAGDADGAVDGVITVAAADRSDGGTLVLEGLTVGAAEILRFDTTDPDLSTVGNEAFLPVILLVEGATAIDGTVDLAGGDGPAAVYYAADGGDGGAGGAGGGVGSNCSFTSLASPGDGFTGGGGATAATCIDFVAGGYGALEGPNGDDGGEGVFTSVTNGALGYAGGTGGGTGMVWGTGGGGGYCCGTSGAGGFGGGGGPGHSEASGWGAGGGGFGTSGENGVGTVGGGASGYTIGGAGLGNGHDTLVPLAGGSGGGGGDSGSGNGDGGGGGGGGGALLLVAPTITVGSAALFDLSGGDGGDTNGVNPGSSTGGGGGAGGGLHLAAASLSGLSGASLDLSGGFGGIEGNRTYVSGDGGEGRLRVDGAAVPVPGAGPTSATASTWEGPAITAVNADSVTVRGSGSLTVYVTDAAGALLGSLAASSGDTLDLTATLIEGDNYVVVAADGVIGPASAAHLFFDPDGDNDGYTYFGGDCDDADAAISPAADEVCDGVDNDCDGLTDDASSLDATAWYTDADRDGYGEDATLALACTAPAGTVAVGGDCDDHDDDVRPDATEQCNGIDDDCDGTVDLHADGSSLGDAGLWYADADGDGWGDDATAITACDAPAGHVAVDGDCADGDAAVNPDAAEICDGLDNDCDGATDDASAAGASTWYYDGDRDGYGDATVALTACDAPSGYGADATDCDDDRDDVRPDAAEVCDGADNDCDGSADENATDEVCDGADNDCDGEIDEDAEGATAWYADLDGDGWGDASDVLLACGPEGYVANAGDCDDAEAGVNPDAAERCDGVDGDCDGEIDEDAVDLATWYTDADGDGYGDDALTGLACDAPDGTVGTGGDCDDADPAYNPGASEADCADPKDYNCDGSVGYEDTDGDGYAACLECDDTSAAVNPAAPEVCNGLDDDCDGTTDIGAADAATWYRDGDRDGWGDAASATLACDAPEDHVAELGDCDDTDSDYHPGADELDCADPNDYNCDGSVGYIDADADGYVACEECDDLDAAVSPEATEVCNGRDDDCDEQVDEEGEGATFYADADGDGFGNPDATRSACDAPEGYVEDATDCDDGAADAFPGGTEVWYDGIDQDCDGNDADQDGDGFLAEQVGGGDCDDTDPAVGDDCDGGGDDTDGNGELVDSGKVTGGGGCGCDAGGSASLLGVLVGLGVLGRRRGR